MVIKVYNPEDKPPRKNKYTRMEQPPSPTEPEPEQESLSKRCWQQFKFVVKVTWFLFIFPIPLLWIVAIITVVASCLSGPFYGPKGRP